MPHPDHPRGRHKARVFAAALGITADRAEELQAAILEAVRTEEATVADQDDYGQRDHLDFTMEGPAGQARVRTAWIVRAGEEIPRLTSSYVL